MEITPQDLVIECYVPKRLSNGWIKYPATAVTITHVPTKISVSSESERNPHGNKSKAWTLLVGKLEERASLSKITETLPTLK